MGITCVFFEIAENCGTNNTAHVKDCKTVGRRDAAMCHNRPAMRMFRWASLLLAFALVLAMATPIFVDRRAHTQAVVAYAKNPSPENAKALSRQQQINESIRKRETLIVCASLFAALICCEWAYRATLRSGNRHRITL
jgi:hypothetical protein